MYFTAMYRVVDDLNQRGSVKPAGRIRPETTCNQAREIIC
jgi:hypothetical protein